LINGLESTEWRHAFFARFTNRFQQAEFPFLCESDRSQKESRSTSLSGSGITSSSGRGGQLLGVSANSITLGQLFAA
jgi:hypothetical protein